MQTEKCHRKRPRTSARTFGSTVRPTAAHGVITPGAGWSQNDETTTHFRDVVDNQVSDTTRTFP
jgi:hypothetical protein